MNDEDHEWEKLEINLDCTPHNINYSKYIISILYIYILKLDMH